MNKSPMQRNDTFYDCIFGDANIDLIKKWCEVNDPNKSDDCGYSPIRVAVCGGQLASVKYLVDELKVNIDDQIGHPFYTLIDWYDSRSWWGVDHQLQKNQIECIKYLIKRGAVIKHNQLKYIDDEAMKQFLQSIAID